MTALRSYVGGAWAEPADEGRPVLDGPSADVGQRPEVRKAYLGL